ncbi:MAG TPA: competence type IV pilus minor pilin ComGD [Pseudogracilibacillus sp.]|nr:competence type IV pilus minor pilin ComGD [Pseudogracilibacillus sp.]
MIKRRNGFTLIELLLVLSTIIILSMIVIPPMSNIINQIKFNHFLQTIESDVLFIQSQAQRKASSRFQIVFTQDEYYVIESTKQLRTEKYPPGTQFKGTLNKKITFGTLGTIKQGDTIRFDTTNKIVKLIFPLGKGRHYVEVSE